MGEQEYQFRTLVESAQDVIARIDRNLRYLYINPACSLYLPLKSEDFIGKTHQELGFPEKKTKEWDSIFQEVFNTGKPQKLELQIDNVNESFFFDWRIYPEFDNKGEVTSIVTVSRDITESKRTGDRLRESEERLRLAFEAATDGYWDWDFVNSKVYFSSRYYAMLGYEPTEFEANEDNFSKLIHPDDAEYVKRTIQEYVEGKRVSHNIEFRMKSKNGDWHWVLSRGRGVHDDQNRLVRMIGTHSDITKRKKAEDALCESESRFRTAIESLPFDFWMMDKDGRYIMQNTTSIKTWGDVTGRLPEELNADAENIEIWQENNKRAFTGEIVRGEVKFFVGGEERVFYNIISPIFDGETIQSILGINIDITERKKLEAQLLQSQKMESIGLLAGGIAHDLNNILGAMMGFTTLLQMQIKEDHPAREYLDHLPALTDRAVTLIKNLMAFSRKQVLDIKPASLNDIVSTIGKLLLRVIGEDIRLNVKLSGKDIVINADAGQIEQALMNLATNARDAMPEGGTLTISTEPFEMDDDFVKMHGYGKPGKYALLTVEDTGMGIDDETREKIFEPFFTTKGVEKGTGLGLAMVYGTIKQHDGYINVYSEAGKGTTFKIYLPAIDTEAVEAKSPDNIPRRGGTETILLVEDEAPLRHITRSMLEEFGYKVIEAEDGIDALNKFNEHNDEIGLVLMDVIMPGKGGKEAYRDMQKIQPHIKVIFTSGYAGDILTSKKIVEEGLHFITKPISPRELLDKIRDVLNIRND